MSADDPDAFRERVRAWFDANAPRKGGPDDFSAVHIVSATTIDDYRAREHEALAVTCRWQRRLFDAGLAGRSWPPEYGGHGAPAWQDAVVAACRSWRGALASVTRLPQGRRTSGVRAPRHERPPRPPPPTPASGCSTCSRPGSRRPAPCRPPARSLSLDPPMG